MHRQFSVRLPARQGLNLPSARILCNSFKEFVTRRAPMGVRQMAIFPVISPPWGAPARVSKARHIETRGGSA
jgi:hypothetical protein